MATPTGDTPTCVVVGATGAMGAVITARLVDRGHRVLAVGRSADELDKLSATSDLITPCRADIASDDAIGTIGAAIDGPVGLALFAAGLPVRGSVDTIEPSALALAANIKVGGVARLLQSVRDRLVEGSRFVAIAGSLGIEPGPLDAGPGTANAALLNLMRQIGALYGPRGVTTHTIAPGPVDTPRLRALIETQSAETGVPESEIWDRYRSKTTLGRLPTLDEIAWLVETLLAPEASVLHGAVLTADGGVRHGIL
ncbi:SDR family oxidoreductase [Gordonia sp. NB41Y]|uniref:SDR family NAD(P)-dependent oxidoreductase n=1 Tax=Gordonia sp. NB41Y TaxID=875808 RepID=UPI0002BD68E7|nr:SDR family oxidoreductase [Gordonia sp. NB41Y]EMP13359.1 short-chain dehydrogenase [Gordonia sp. NB41Y]WLP88756.1 SDR family oxidoreductase [Gordonia sp. NB41Y]